MENNDKITTGWRLPTKLKDEFTAFCNSTPDSIEEECAAAVFLFMRLPEKIRELAKLEAKGVSMVDPQFWKDFAQGLELGITAQLNIQQKGRKKSRKK